MVKPVLVFGYGNPSRGDDALGPALLQQLYKNKGLNNNQIELLTDFQLQIEHVLDIEQRQLVLFADASVSCKQPFQLFQLKPQNNTGYTSHAMHPAAVMQVYLSVKNEMPPPCFLLSIGAKQFELGQDISDSAQQNLQLAYELTLRLLENPTLLEWQSFTNNARNIVA